MDVREKLAELLTEFYGSDPMYYGVDALAIAQHLIANGVTVQSERMVDAVPVSELEKLRDYLCAEDLIFMRELAKLNKLIANYEKRKEDK